MGWRKLASCAPCTLTLAWAVLSTTAGCDTAPSEGAAHERKVTDAARGAEREDAGDTETTEANVDDAKGQDGLSLPPAVCKVMRDNACLTCHQGEGQGGAPMGLEQRGDFLAEGRDGSSIGERVLARMRDGSRPMPPPSSGRPLASDADLKVLRDWVDNGMFGVDGPACTAEATHGSDGPAWASSGWPEEGCDYVMTVGAHEKSGTPLADDPAGFPLPNSETYYHCFYEKVPWGNQPVQAIAVRAHVETPDDKQLVHHMQLSSLGPKDNTSLLGAPRPKTGGFHQPCANPNGATVGTWGPGALNPVTVPDDVGVLMPSGDDAYLELQVHYHNPKRDTGKRSRTYFDVCVTSKARENTAGIHTLGFENSAFSAPFAALGPAFQARLDNKGNGTAVGVCTAKKRARILSIAPHMHGLGRHSKVEILRNDGTVEVIHDMAFSFDDQMSYLFDDLWIEQGEKVRTTCTWDTSRKIVFGFASQDEMCFVTTLAYPAGALAGTGNEKGFAGGDLSCAGQGG